MSETPGGARWTRNLLNKGSSKLRKHFKYGDCHVRNSGGARWTRNLLNKCSSKLRKQLSHEDCAVAAQIML